MCSRGLALGSVLPVALLAHGLPHPRLAEKKASIGYTYEDSTVAEVEKVAEKPEEEESPAEEESNSDEDEVIPDIGGVPSLPSPTPQSLGIVFVSRSSPSVGRPTLKSPVSPAPALGHSSLRRLPRLTHVLLCAGLPLCIAPLISGTLLLCCCPHLGSVSVLFCLGQSLCLPLFLSPLENKCSFSSRAAPPPTIHPVPKYPRLQPSTCLPVLFSDSCCLSRIRKASFPPLPLTHTASSS